MEKLVVVERDGRGLRRIVDLAVELRAGKRVQSVELAEDQPGVEVGLLPETAGMVKDSGGWEAYRSDLLARFRAVGGVERPKGEAGSTEAESVAPRGSKRQRQRSVTTTDDRSVQSPLDGCAREQDALIAKEERSDE